MRMTRTNIENSKKNPFWQESITLFANLLENSRDNKMLTRAKRVLVFLYKAVGRGDKAVEIAETFSEISLSREIILYQATDREEMCKYAQEALVKLLYQLYHALSAVILSRYRINRKDDFADIKKRAEKIRDMANLSATLFHNKCYSQW